MKAIVKLLILGGVVLVAMTGCTRAGAFNPFLGGSADTEGTQETEGTLIETINTTESESDPEGLPFMLGMVMLGPLAPDADQVMTLPFMNGVVDVDEDGSVPGLTIYELLDTPETSGEYARGSTVTYSADVVPDGTGHSTLWLTLDLSGATVSDPIELAFDPETFTANNGARQFNQDFDDTPGEAAEDALFLYPRVNQGGGAPVTATGDNRNPRVGVNFTLPGGVGAGDPDLSITGISVAGSYADRFSTASLDAFSVFTFDTAALEWSEESVTPDYDNAGTLTLTLPDAVTAAEIYQIRYDRYNIRTSDAAYGFIQKDTTNQNGSNARYGRSALLAEGAIATLDTGVTDDITSDPPVQIRVGFNGVGDIVQDTLTAESVRFFFDEDGNGEDLTPLPWERFVLEDGTDGNNEFVFYFANTFDPDGNDDWYLYVYPTVRDDNGTTDTDDDLPVLDVNETGAGVSTDTGTF